MPRSSGKREPAQPSQPCGRAAVPASQPLPVRRQLPRSARSRRSSSQRSAASAALADVARLDQAPGSAPECPTRVECSVRQSDVARRGRQRRRCKPSPARFLQASAKTVMASGRRRHARSTIHDQLERRWPARAWRSRRRDLTATVATPRSAPRARPAPPCRRIHQKHERPGAAVHRRQLRAADLDQDVVDLAGGERGHQMVDHPHAGTGRVPEAGDAVGATTTLSRRAGIAARAGAVDAAEPDAGALRRWAERQATLAPLWRPTPAQPIT